MEDQVYEGCLTGDSQIETPEGTVDLYTLFQNRQLIEDLYIDISNEDIQVKTVGGFVKVSGLTYKGVMPITGIIIDNGTSLTGYKHPILALTSNGDLDWKFIEDLVEGDQIVTEQ